MLLTLWLGRRRICVFRPLGHWDRQEYVSLTKINPQIGRRFIVCEVLFSGAYHFSLWQHSRTFKKNSCLKRSRRPILIDICIKKFFSRMFYFYQTLFCLFLCMFASFHPSFLAFKFTFVLLMFLFVATIFVSIIYLFMFPFTLFALQCFVFSCFLRPDLIYFSLHSSSIL